MTTHANRLGWMLDDLTKMPDVRYAVLLATDGIAMGHSESVHPDTADTIAASASGFHSIGVALAPYTGGQKNGLRQVVGEFDEGFLFVKTVGANALLAVSTSNAVDAEVLTYRMNGLTERLGEELSSPARNQGDEGGARP
ncbi:roadblock/LC7 domain-containing protein [Streptomyces sp. DG2A-72]|uniref:roadblock/LC7 domain-containing protein n=1 Tax=Streptomyces sp. DG2A-72 TaxID=3051386 RepID=UPI00265BAA3B|nr:roadblock/LC7 domain-containing protein [Streptomyces sp. DG2A-72]MDO0936568.1 roadblock/LC7 domain-containing protein [Streptomyces sp. DG2A-72]